MPLAKELYMQIIKDFLLPINNYKSSFTCLLILFFLNGCCWKTPDLELIYDNSLTAKVGEPYYLKIETLFVVYEIKFDDSKLDDGMNLNVLHPAEDGGASRGVFEIKGTPQHEGIAQLTVEGSTPGTSCSGQHFIKTISVIILGKDSVLEAKKIIPTPTKIITTCL